ncbi:MAG: hypothetical protein ABI193_12615 [Minicystis sp.]
MISLSRLSVAALGLFVVSLGLSLAGCGGNNACSDFCARTLACSTKDGCTLKDEGAAQDACVSACSEGIDALEGSTRDATEACMNCISADASECGGSPKSCKSVCETAEVEKGGEVLGAKLDSLDGDARLVCTNGDSAFGGGSCEGSSSGDGTSESCDSKCSNGSVTVSAKCAGMQGGMVNCECTQGVAKGRAFTAPSCSDFFAQNLWNACNVADAK